MIFNYMLFQQMSEMAAVKTMPDMIKLFGGKVGDDVEAWIQKVELAGNLTGVKDKACFIPLYLEGVLGNGVS